MRCCVVCLNGVDEWLCRVACVCCRGLIGVLRGAVDVVWLSMWHVCVRMYEWWCTACELRRMLYCRWVAMCYLFVMVSDVWEMLGECLCMSHVYDKLLTTFESWCCMLFGVWRTILYVWFVFDQRCVGVGWWVPIDVYCTLCDGASLLWLYVALYSRLRVNVSDDRCSRCVWYVLYVWLCVDGVRVRVLMMDEFVFSV